MARTRSTRSVSLVAVGGALVLGLVGLPGIVAVADPDPLAALENVPETARGTSTDVRANIANVPTGELTQVNEIAGMKISVPESAEGTVVIENTRGARLAVSMPAGSNRDKGKPVAPGVMAYDTGNGTTILPVIRDDGSVQVLTIVEDRSAPRKYTYSVDLPTGGEIQALDDGGLAFIGAAGEYIGGAAAPWAYDANGAAILTSYSIKGNTFTQNVDHQGPGVAYPVVADPWLGQDLYYNPWTSQFPQGWKVNVVPRSWGTTQTAPTMYWAHRDEVKTKLGSGAWKYNATVEQQHYCHILGLPLSLPTYNLENWRANLAFNQIAPYNCNYPEGGWGSATS